MREVDCLRRTVEVVSVVAIPRFENASERLVTDDSVRHFVQRQWVMLTEGIVIPAFTVHRVEVVEVAATESFAVIVTVVLVYLTMLGPYGHGHPV